MNITDDFDKWKMPPNQFLGNLTGDIFFLNQSRTFGLKSNNADVTKPPDPLPFEVNGQWAVNLTKWQSASSKNPDGRTVISPRCRVDSTKEQEELRVTEEESKSGAAKRLESKKIWNVKAQKDLKYETVLKARLKFVCSCLSA